MTGNECQNNRCDFTNNAADTVMSQPKWWCEGKPVVNTVHGRNFIAESGGDDSRIFSRATQKLLYRAVFHSMFPQACNI